MAAEEGEERYTFFFGAASPFSQHHLCEFSVEGEKYNCAEQYMMHQKAVLFNDPETAVKILNATDPKLQKKLGRQVRNFVDQQWKKECRGIVKTGNLAKFSQNEDLLQALRATEGTVLVEASPRDCIWGIGLGAKHPNAKRKATWRGKNCLGYILTEVRNELMEDEKHSRTVNPLNEENAKENPDIEKQKYGGKASNDEKLLEESAK